MEEERDLFRRDPSPGDPSPASEPDDPTEAVPPDNDQPRADQQPDERPDDQQSADQQTEGAAADDDTAVRSQDPPGRAADPGGVTEQQYIRSITREYQGLAETMAKAEAGGEEYEQSAVVAHVPGLETGVVGYGDITGEEDEDPEQIEELDRARRSELALRIGTGLAAVLVFFGALYAGPFWATLLMGAVSLGAAAELYQALRKAGFAPMALIGLLGAAGMFYAAWASGPFGAAAVLMAVVMISGFWFALGSRSYPLANISVTVLGVSWAALPVSFAVPMFRSSDSLALVTALVGLTALNDIAAFSYGRAFGSRSFAPRLSPNKTLEGFLGATVITLLAGLIAGRFGLLEPLTMVSGLVLAAVISALGPIGDLAESAVKRSIGVKDMGSILPGHGGLLDRLDAYLFTVPAAYLVYLWFGYL